MRRKVARKDSTAANKIFGDVNKRYDSLKKALRGSNQQLPLAYSGRLDSMQTAMTFLKENKFLNQTAESQEKYKTVLKEYGNVQEQLNRTNFIEKQLKERQESLKKSLAKLPLKKEFEKYAQKISRYKTELNVFKNVIEKPEKLEQALLSMTRQLPAFRQYFNKYSQLGALFQLPGTEAIQASLPPGMQSRAMINQNIQDRIGVTGNAQSVVTGNLGQAKSTLDRIKSKINEYGRNSENMDIPDHGSDKEKMKPFWKRIQLGTDIQNNRSNSFFPTTTDFGLTIGYKLSTRFIAGIGTSYRMGWGKNWRKITITHEGAGLRSFIDGKLKGNFWFTAGAEMNHNRTFKNIDELKNKSAWESSALAGLNKKIQLKNRKAEVKLMYDFLWQTHHASGQPLVFRMGYTLK
jgi:hypothetical protein